MIIVGKFLDWHLRQTGQERTKNVIGDIYLRASYGTLFKDYCEYLTNIASRLNVFVVYAANLAAFYMCAFAINLYLFSTLNLRASLFDRYISLAFLVALFGLIDFKVVISLMKLAAKGRYILSMILSIAFAYLSLIFVSAFLATFFIKTNLPVDFYLKFFTNRFDVLALAPFSSGLTVSSSNGSYVHIAAFAYPAILISTSTLVSALAVKGLASNRLSPIYDYLATRVFSKDEKSIHLKLATAMCSFLSIIFAAVSLL